MGEPADNSVKRLEIRKYPNRRYYDSTRSRHVTLEEIHGLIQEGYEVHVVDSRTGEDITSRVLAQILIELDTPKLAVFPAALLHRLLRSNEQLVRDFVHKYFNEALTTFLDSQRSMEQYMRKAMGMPSRGPTVADWTKLMMGPFNPALWPGGGSGTSSASEAAEAAVAAGAAAPAEEPEPGETGPASARQGEEEANLRRVVEALRREVDQLRQKARPKRTKRPAARKRPAR